MAAYFFDSSALVKRYVREVGTAWVINHFQPSANHTIYVARITHVEVISALTRKTRAGTLLPDEFTKAVSRFRRNFQRRFFTIDITTQLIEEASSMTEKYALRGYDAVQLAAALRANRVRLSTPSASLLIFISADITLNAAAIAEGLTVDNPKNHP